MACKWVLAPSFPILINRLLEELRLSCETTPLDPKWVVVPTSTAANQVRIRVGQQAVDTPLAGIRILPVMNFLRRISREAGGAAYRRWGPVLDLLLFELVEKMSEDSLLACLQRMPSGYRLLRPTFLDLADGGFGLEQIEFIEELIEEPELAPLEKETLRLYARWILNLEARQVSWEPLFHQKIPEWIRSVDPKTLASALACEQGQRPKVFVYGFYDFTDVNAQIIAALGGRVDLTFFYPVAGDQQNPHSAFSFAYPVLEDLAVRLGTALTTREDLGNLVENSQPRSHSEVARYFVSTFPEGEVESQPDFLSFHRASGVQAELLSAAVRIRQWVDDPIHCIAPAEIMMIAPDIQPYLAAAREVFSAFAIPLRIVDAPAGSTPENRPIRILARIWEAHAPSEWVLAYLRDWSGIPAVRSVNAEEFESKVRQLGIWGGESWRCILELNPRDSEVFESHLPEFTAQERDLVEEILRLWVPGSKDRTFTPVEAADFLRVLRDRWLQSPEQIDLLLTALDSVTRWSPDLVVRESLLREMFLQLVSEQVESDPLDRSGVLFVTLMRSRGLTARAVVFLGLASGTMPTRIHEDPLLSDDSRRRLARKAEEIGHRLPIKSHVSDEMSLLFFLSNTAAQHLHWVIPETDDTGRSVAPTPWVQRYVQHWSQEPEKNGSAERIARGPSQQAQYLRDLDDQKGSFLPPHFLVFIQPDLVEAISSEIPYQYLFEAADSRRRESKWNGHIPGASLPQADHDRVRVTDLGILARCPYRFYAERLKEWKALAPLYFSEEMRSLNWGKLLHGFLELLVSRYLEENISLGEIAGRFLRDGGRALEDEVERLPECFPEELQILPPVFQRAALRKLSATVRAYLEHLREGSARDSVPLETEVKRRVPFPGLDPLHITGRIDRVDSGTDSVHIYDYKSGRQPCKRKLEQEVALGYLVQPRLYPWMFSHGMKSRSSMEFSFVFLQDAPPSERKVNCDCDVQGEEFLKPLGSILTTGCYLPTPTETLELLRTEGADVCRFCEYVSLCRRFDPGARYRYFRLFKRHLRARVDSLPRKAAGGDG